MTVLEAIQRSTEFLSRKGVDAPRLHAELLLAHALKLPRMRLYLDFERVLTASDLAAYREMVTRRGRRQPLQHIVGSVSFCGLELAVSRDALIPRPETELLAEQGWRFLEARAAAARETVWAIDLGTGTGCLAIALAWKVPSARVYALDVSAPALDLARENARRQGVEGRIEFVQSDGFAGLPAQVRGDLVLSNPPYIPSGEIDFLAPEVRDADPRPALDGGPDGLDFYRLLAGEAARHIKTDGRLMVEFGDGQAESLRNLFEGQNWIVERITDDYTGRPRMLSAHPKGPLVEV